MNLFCRVCGFKHDEPQWGDDDHSPIYDYCPCCGVESGNHDYTVKSVKRYREFWIHNGLKWDNPRLKPENWSPEIQMDNVPFEFR